MPAHEGAALVSADPVDDLVKILPNARICQSYGKIVYTTLLLNVSQGTTDAACTICTVFFTDTRFGVTGSAGRIVPGMVAKSVKHDGTLAVFNEPGELQAWVNC